MTKLDLPPGKVRIKIGGGNGGHNGLRSIDPRIGTGYRRVRLGIGHPGHKDRVPGYVLHDFGKTDRAWLDPLMTTLADNAGLIVKGDDSGLMNKLAIATQGDGANRPERPATADPARKKGQSHVHAARTPKPDAPVPERRPAGRYPRQAVREETGLAASKIARNGAFHYSSAGQLRERSMSAAEANTGEGAIKDVRSAVFAACAIFLLFGLNIGIWAAHVPVIQARLALDTATLGLCLLGSGLGTIASQLLAGVLIGRIGLARP